MAGAGAEGLVVLLWGPDSRVRLTVAWALLPIVLVLCEVLLSSFFNVVLDPFYHEHISVTF